jgi:hypothetical protein
MMCNLPTKTSLTISLFKSIIVKHWRNFLLCLYYTQIEIMPPPKKKRALYIYKRLGTPTLPFTHMCNNLSWVGDNPKMQGGTQISPHLQPHIFKKWPKLAILSFKLFLDIFNGYLLGTTKNFKYIFNRSLSYIFVQ